MKQSITTNYTIHTLPTIIHTYNTNTNTLQTHISKHTAHTLRAPHTYTLCALNIHITHPKQYTRTTSTLNTYTIYFTHRDKTHIIHITHIDTDTTRTHTDTHLHMLSSKNEKAL